jgi:thiol-disulfide isomerase/thioredoxin
MVEAVTGGSSGRVQAGGGALLAARRCTSAIIAALVLGAAVVGCSSGDDAVAQVGSFEFVSPGGQVDIFYDPPQSRGRPGPIRGPDLMTPDRTLSLDDFAGQVVVINVWGQWCGPCRTEMPELQQVYDATRTAGVAFLGIDVRDNNRQAAVDFIVDRKITFPSIYDPPMRTMIALGASYPTTVIPSTIVLDRRHRVAAVFLRALLAEDLEPLVRRLASEAPTDPEPQR